ncbi:MAG: peptide chain release factor 3, partial [Bacilli bacterium]
AGDIIGLFDPGIFRIGDTICQGETFEFTEMPYFSPEIFSRVTVKDSLKSKSFQKGINQLTEEGAIQVFHSFGTGIDQTILGVVGVLQFEVLQYRMKAEYGVEVMLQRLPFQLVRWVRGEDFDPRQFQSTSYACVKDRYGDTAVLFENEFSLRWAVDKHTSLKFVDHTRM